MLNKPVVRVILVAGAMAIPALSQSSNSPDGNGPPAWVSKNPNDPSVTKEEKKRAATERPVTGVVTDADGKVISGAVVQLKNTRTLQVRSYLTRENGDYYFAGLSKDVDYELKAQSKGKASASKTLSSFDPKPTPVINLQVK